MLSSNGRFPGQRHRCSRNATVASARSPENAGRTSPNSRATAGGWVGAVCAVARAAGTASAAATARTTIACRGARRCDEDAASSRRPRVSRDFTSARSARDAVAVGVVRVSHGDQIEMSAHCLRSALAVTVGDRIDDGAMARERRRQLLIEVRPLETLGAEQLDDREVEEREYRIAGGAGDLDVKLGVTIDQTRRDRPLLFDLGGDGAEPLEVRVGAS